MSGRKRYPDEYIDSALVDALYAGSTEQKKTVTYKELPSLCKENGFGSVKEFFSHSGFEIKAPDKDFEKLADALFELPVFDVQTLSGIADSLVSKSCKTHEVKTMKPTHRAFWLLTSRVGRNDRRSSDVPDGLLRAWEDQHMGTKIRTADFPQIASYFSVSLRWLWCYENTEELFYCDNLTAEKVLDSFSLLSPRLRRYFLSLVESRLQEVCDGTN